MANDFELGAAGDRLPPQNIEAETEILGGILLDPDALARVSEVLKPEAFYLTAHQEIYRAAMLLAAQGRPTDLMSVSAWLADRELLDRVGGTAVLRQLVEQTPSSINIDQYAKLVVDKYIRRQLLRASNAAASLAYDTSMEVPQVMDRIEQEMFEVTQDRVQRALVPASDILLNIFAQLEEKAERDDSLPGLPTGFYDLDSKTQGLQRSDLIIVAGRPSMGKCLAAESELVLADGSIVTIAQIYRRGAADLLTLKRDGRFGLAQPSAFVNDGLKPVFRVTTRLGRAVETTLVHPFLTLQGWRSLGELQVGDRIAVPRKIDLFGREHWRDCAVKLLAYTIGDSCLTQAAPEFVHSNPVLRAEFAGAAAEFAGLGVKLEDFGERELLLARSQPLADGFGDAEWPSPPAPLPSRSVASAVSLGEGSNSQEPLGFVQFPFPQDWGKGLGDGGQSAIALMLWLQELGLWGKGAAEQCLPAGVFRLERQQLALFLNRMFASQGWAVVSASGRPQLGYASASERLARQLQHLLLRFGVIARLQQCWGNDRGDRRPTWQLEITEAQSIRTFADRIGIFGQEAALDEVRQALSERHRQTHQDLLATNDEIYWDEIVSIEATGYKQVYDLTIPDTHNFVANDICVHNTAICLNIAHNVAAQSKLPIAVFSLEMSREQLVQRMLSSEAKIESHRLRSGRISEHEWQRLSQAIGHLSELPIFIDDTANSTVTEIRSKARRLQAEQGGALGMILLDYLQLMEGSGSDNRVLELARITRGLKALAKELNAPVVVLSQLSRAVESRSDKRPQLSDLRESGSIEQDADLVLMLYREEYYDPNTTEKGLAELMIVKHRNGPTGTVKLLFENQYTQFRNLASKPS
ncbi:replicative DNA helicase [Synechococcus sp. PCC 7336]|uniref:replicative DNA helicase n=1 Tax=Synechococcus sp. PCC 7336 TaxID=195250 RepID=UPI00034C1C6C|nr:replicative DNA helicase [Synechococcus sp. PCC 7336]